MPKDKRPTVEFVAEPLEKLKARWPEALKGRYHVEGGGVKGLRPGEQRRHIFDCEDGLRIIASIDTDDDNKEHVEFLHFSVSVTSEQVGAWAKVMPLNLMPTPLLRMQYFIRQVARAGVVRIKQISDYDVTKDPQHISEHGVCHWFIPWIDGE